MHTSDHSHSAQHPHRLAGSLQRLQHVHVEQCRIALATRSLDNHLNGMACEREFVDEALGDDCSEQPSRYS